MKASTISKHLSVEQQELLFIYNKKSEPTTIEELQEELKLPRTTIVDHLKLLEKDNFILYILWVLYTIYNIYLLYIL